MTIKFRCDCGNKEEYDFRQLLNPKKTKFKIDLEIHDHISNAIKIECCKCGKLYYVKE